MRPTDATDPKKQRLKPPREVDYSDVDDVIGIASELQDLDSDRLSVEELEAVAKDLEIPTEYVGPAVAELRRRRAVALERAAARSKRNHLIAYAAIALVALLVVWAVAAQSSLASDAAAVEQARATVRNVESERHKRIEIYAGQPDSPEKKAALLGAETRVKVERGRYDEAVRTYNERVAAFPGSVFATIFGLPEPFQSSDQLTW